MQGFVRVNPEVKTTATVAPTPVSSAGILDRAKAFAKRSDIKKSAPAALRALVTLGVGAFIVWRLSHLGWPAVIVNLPMAPAFYLLFACAYLTAPIIDSLIFQSIWGVKARALASVMFRKRVLNEAVMGYSGEAFLGLWARKNLKKPVAQIFHDIKDSNFVSSFVSLSATVVLVAISLLPIAEGARRPLIGGLVLGAGILIIGFCLRSTALAMRGDLVKRVAGLHTVRLLTVLALQIGQWSIALPETPISAWLALMAAYFLTTRIPFLPSYDLVLLGLGLTAAPVLHLPADAAAGLFVASTALSQISNLIVYAATTTGKSDTAVPPESRLPHHR